MIRFILVLSFAWCVPALLAQSGETQTPVPPCQIKEYLNRSGWNIPGLSKADVKTSHARYTSEGLENVYVDILEPTVPQDFITFVFIISGSAEVRNRPVDVTQIEQFMMNGHVFGYHVIATDAGFDKNGKRIHFGAQERVYYYDPDGSGKFTVMHNAGELFFKIIVPDWVKHTTTSKTRKSKDGRNRSQTEVADTNDATSTRAGRTKEQRTH